MSAFDLLFLCAALLAVGVLIAALVLALGGRPRRAGRLLGALAVGAVVYVATGLVVSAVSPQRVVRVGEPWCFDDWCLAVERVTSEPAGSAAAYRLDFRIFSRAGRISQRANGAWIYLVDDRGRRYAPEPDPEGVPLDVMLGPKQSVETSRVFRLPGSRRVVGLITGHGGRYCGVMSVLVIGSSGCVFHKATMVRLDDGSGAVPGGAAGG